MKNICTILKSPDAIKGILIRLKNTNLIRLFLSGVLLTVFASTYGQTYNFSSPQGYGAGATGGGSASPVTVTTQAALKTALTASGSGVVLVSGTITCTYMSVLVSNKTLIGLPGARLKNLDQTAAGSGILTIKPGSNNVIIRNLTFEGAGAYDTDGRDLLCLEGATKIWVDHCEFQDGVDGNYDHKGLTDNVTVSWCKFTYLKPPKAGGSGGTDDHRFTNLVGSDDADKPADGKFSITWQYCWWASGCVERQVRARNAQLDMVNCYWNSTASKYGLGLGGVSDCYVENSVFANSGTRYKYYDNGTVRLACPGTTGGPANVGVCPAPAYTREAIAASSVVSAITGACGAGATLNVTSAGVVSANSACSGTTNSAPTVSITAPANNATYTAPASVTITANAADSDGSISKVDFYNGTTLLISDNSSPYSYSWTGVAAGTYSITAKATDNGGAVTTSTAVSITVSAVVNKAPTVTITSPAYNAPFTAPATVTISADATDADGTIAKVEFYNGTTLLNSDNTSPYSYTWLNVAAGSYSITVKATDNSGAVTTSSAMPVDVGQSTGIAPTVSITAPANNAIFTAPAGVTITANAADSDGTIAKVDFYNGTTLLGSDATAPYSYDWTGVAAGTYSITAKATDNSSTAATSSAVSITVNAVVSQPLTTPTNVSATPYSNSASISWAAVSNATGYLLNFCSPGGGVVISKQWDFTGTWTIDASKADANLVLDVDPLRFNYIPATTDAALTFAGGAPIPDVAGLLFTQGGATKIRLGFGKGFLYLNGTGLAVSIPCEVGDKVTVVGPVGNATAITRGYSVTGGTLATAECINVDGSGIMNVAGAIGTWVYTATSTSVKITTVIGGVNIQTIKVSKSGSTPPSCTEYTVQGGNTTSYTVTGLTPSTSYTYQVKATNGTPAEASAYTNAATVTTGIVTGITDKASALHSIIYPNPSAESFNVFAKEEIKMLNIVNVMGAVVYSKENIAAGNTEIDATIKEGTYFIELQYLSGTRELMKFVKMK